MNRIEHMQAAVELMQRQPATAFQEADIEAHLAKAGFLPTKGVEEMVKGFPVVRWRRGGGRIVTNAEFHALFGPNVMDAVCAGGWERW